MQWARALSTLGSIEMKQALTVALAGTVTAAAVALAIASAWQRAESDSDRLLLATVASVIVLAVHLLPALLRARSGWIVWPVWTLCLAGALWGHATFFASAWQGAAEARAASSTQARALQERRAVIEADLAATKARPVAAIVRQISWTKSDEQAQALRVELAEAQRATRLRDELLSLSVTGSVTAVTDPLLARVTAVTGWTTAAISLAVSVGMAVLVEVLGALLWLEALAGQKPAFKARLHAPEEMELVELEATNLPPDLERLRAAVKAGHCAPRVADIRNFLGVSQARAMQLRRELISTN